MHRLRKNTMIIILPKAGKENPFQHQMVELLRKEGLKVAYGRNARFFSVFKSVIGKQPKVLYFDWIHRFIIGRSPIISWVKIPTFFFELWWMQKIKGCKIVHTLHNMSNHAQLQPKVEQKYYAKFLKQVDRIRVYDESTKQSAAEQFQIPLEKIKVIADVPYHHFYKNECNKEEARQKLRIDSNAFVYLYLGAIKPYKGVPQLITTFGEMKEQNDLLIIAGKPEKPSDIDAINKAAKGTNQLRLELGFIADDQIQYYMNAADVCVFPFKKIEHSGSVDLAMGFKKTIISKRTPLLSSFLSAQKNLLFDDEKQIGDLMLRSKTVDKETIGALNFERIDNTNFLELPHLFDNLL